MSFIRQWWVDCLLMRGRWNNPKMMQMYRVRRWW